MFASAYLHQLSTLDTFSMNTACKMFIRIKNKPVCFYPFSIQNTEQNIGNIKHVINMIEPVYHFS